MRPKAVLSDCDGVIWVESEAIPGSVEALNEIEEMGIRRILVSNNSTRTRVEYMAITKNFGLSGITQDCIFSSGFACALYLRNHDMLRVFVIGSPALIEEIRLAGITVFTNALSPEEETNGIEAIVVSKSPKFGYEELKYSIYLYHKFRCPLIGTNPDPTVPAPNGTVTMGSGSFVACFEMALGTKATIIGKPCEPMFETVLKFLNCTADQVIMIGDRLCTDIQFASRHGARSVLVLSGIDQMNDVEKIPESDRPTYVLRSLADVVPLLRAMPAEA
jgi:phosphoglycolate/pyridoxal phosphate phosphatase family enzyme